MPKKQSRSGLPPSGPPVEGLVMVLVFGTLPPTYRTDMRVPYVKCRGGARVGLCAAGEGLIGREKA